MCFRARNTQTQNLPLHQRGPYQRDVGGHQPHVHNMRYLTDFLRYVPHDSAGKSLITTTMAMIILSKRTRGPYGLFLCCFSVQRHKDYYFLFRWLLIPLTAPVFVDIVILGASSEGRGC